MRKIIGKFLCTVLLFVLFLEPVLASDVVCEYPDKDLIFTYKDKGDGTHKNMPLINYDDWLKSDWVLNLVLVKTGRLSYRSEDIEIDQDLYYENLENYACPNKFKICEYSQWSLNLPSLQSLGYTVDAVVEFLWKIVTLGGHQYNEAELLGNAYALIDINNTKIYFLSEDSYNRHEYKKYKDGKFSGEMLDAFIDVYDTLNWDLLDGIPILDQLNWLVQVVGGAGGGLWDLVYQTFASDGEQLIYYRKFDCQTVTYKGEYIPVDVNCKFLDEGLMRYDNILTEYKNCTDENCKTAKVKELNMQQTRLKTNCDNVLQNYMYNATQRECIESCLDLGQTLNEKKFGTDLYRNPEDGYSNSCRFSKRLVDWILKIIAWVRYGIPIVLIILSILDFIKSLAADSDDEIKKMASKFVKRLIVSVIIFLLPLMLEFLFGIFGIPVRDFCL